jgi:hypothetical protein
MTVTLDQLATSVHQFFQDKLPGEVGSSPGSLMLVFDPFGMPLAGQDFGVGGSDSQQQLLAHQRAAQLADQLPGANGLTNGWYLAQSGSRLSRWYQTLISESSCTATSDQDKAAFEARKAAALKELDLNAMLEVTGTTSAGTTVDPTGVHDTLYATGMTPTGWYRPDADCWETHHIDGSQPASPDGAGPVPTPGFHLRVDPPPADSEGPAGPPSLAFFMPKVTDDGRPFTVTHWEKNVGDPVTAGESIVNVESDKVETGLDAPFTGTLLELTAKEGDTISVGGVLALIGDGPPPAPPTTKGFDVTFEYCLVSFDRPWWDDVFMATSSWSVSGFTTGQIASGFASSPALGIPAITAGMIVIRNLQITADWTDSDQQRLNTNAVSLGPFSVAGASFNGQTLTRAGMQASAWICQVPPKLPPDEPEPPQA